MLTHTRVGGGGGGGGGGGDATSVECLFSIPPLPGGVVEFFGESHFHHGGFHLGGYHVFGHASEGGVQCEVLLAVGPGNYSGQVNSIKLIWFGQVNCLSQVNRVMLRARPPRRRRFMLTCKSGNEIFSVLDNDVASVQVNIRGFLCAGRRGERSCSRPYFDREVGPEHVELGADAEVGADRAHLRFNREAVDDRVAGGQGLTPTLFLLNIFEQQRGRSGVLAGTHPGNALLQSAKE